MYQNTSERKRKRGRPRTTPVISYEAEMKMRNKIPRTIKKPKYLLEEENSNPSRSSTPSRTLDDRGPYTSSSKNSRGYNPDFDDKNSEYHYGSDFENDLPSENYEGESDAPSLSDTGYMLSDDEGVLSDNEIQESRDVFNTASPMLSRPSTPDAIWLQDQKVPPLVLPPSADDLLMPSQYVLPALGIYEVLRHFRTLVRLSPFRFEDFCGSLLTPQQTVLLAEIHIALLRALIREDESQSTHFGPIDHKDSINIMLYLIDPLTWPQVLHNYLNSDLKGYHSVVKMLESCNYPYTTLQNRLVVLRCLTDAVLCVSGVREELISEGKLRYDDHCRSCHKTGELLCCDSCTAVYHLDCIDKDAPMPRMDDWTCSVCIKHQVKGVTDSLSAAEASGMLSRHDPLGYDRHGRKYWFLARRLIIESSGGELWYYSTTDQVHSIFNMLDGAVYEQELVMSISEQRHEIIRQLSITEELTQELCGSRSTVLHRNDEEIKVFLLNRKNMKDEIKPDLVNGEDIPEGSSMFGFNANGDQLKVELKDEVKNENEDDPSSSSSSAAESRYDLWGSSIVGRDWTLPEEEQERVYKEKLSQLRSINKEYRLGADCGQNYVNQYTANTLALNKLQHNEDRDKKRHLSHKFSMSASIEFKWTGTLYGSDKDMMECVKSCLQQIEQQISVHLYHPQWSLVRKSWLAKVTSASSPKHFIRCLLWLVAAIKPVVFHPVWHEALGHIRLSRVTAAEREERKRQEKKDKKDMDLQTLDDFRNTMPVRFTKLPKHQLWKVKGEEYRLNVGDGWRWWTRTRRVQHVPASTVGLRAGPDKVMVGVNMTGGLRGLPVAPDVFNKLAAKTPGLIGSIYSPQYRREHGLDQNDVSEEQNEIIISNSVGGGTGSGTQKVEVVVTPLENYFEDGLVNVSRSLVGRTRLVYAKVPVSSPFLDGLLAHRLAMPRHSASKNGNGSDDGCNDADGDSRDGKTDGAGGAGGKEDTIQEIPDSQRYATHRLRPAGNLLKEIRNHKLRYEALDESAFHYKCYSQACRTPGDACYSPLCRAKARTREKLLNSVKNYTIVTSKPSPYQQVGVYDIIDLSKMDQGESASEPKKNPSSSSESPKDSGSSSKAAEADNSTNEGGISVKVDADLDECSRSSADNKCTDNGSEEPESCSGKFFLKLKTTEVTSKKTAMKLPQVATCTVGSDRYSMLVLPKWELKVLCRRGWKHSVSGFNHLAKSNTSVWPYQCSRPVFKHTWLYRTVTLTSYSSVALQLRILWSCLRWDDMQEKGASDGKKQVTTDTEIVQTEILKRKSSGRFNEKTEYLRRKVTIPFEVPKPMREFTPSQRSGLRKRRRAQSPEDKKPESVEEWVPEDQLQLWEIRLFGERLERAANQPKKTEQHNNPPTLKITMPLSSGSSTDLKQRLEEQLKQQRAAFQQQQRDGRTLLKISSISSSGGVKTSPVTGIKTVVGGTSATNVPTKKFMLTKDGRVINVQTLGSIQSGNGTSPSTNTVIPLSGGMPKVQIASNPGNKVIRLQNVASANQRMILPRTPVTAVQATTPATQTPATGSSALPGTIRLPNQNIQILRLPDGQLQVKGLLEHQHMVQRADGKFQIVNRSPTAVGTTATGSNVVIAQQKPPTPVLKTVQFPQQQIVKVNGQQVLVRKDGTQVVSVGAGDALKLSGTAAGQPGSIAANTTNVVKTMVTSDGTMIKTVVPPGSVQQQNLTVVQQPQQQQQTVTQKTDSSSITLRVQVRMTEQGPKTIIQGLHPSIGLTKDHIRAIQQQVRTMLSQYDLKINQLSPIMTLTLHMSNANQQQQSSAAPAAQQTVVIPQQQQQQQQQQQGFATQQPQVGAVQQGSQQQVLKTVVVGGVKQQQLVQQPTGLKLSTIMASNSKTSSNNATAYIRTAAGVLVPNNSLMVQQKGGVGGKEQQPGDKNFVLTNEYIQETIQSALDRNDLSPDVEEKLVQLKKYNTEQHQPSLLTATPLSARINTKRQRDDSESSEGRSSGRVKRIRNLSQSGDTSVTPPGAKLASPSRGRGGDGSGDRSRRRGGASSQAVASNLSSPSDDPKKRQAVQVKLENQLSKHKEMLKKDILKKRAFLEKDLQLQIHKELGIARQHLQALEKKGLITPLKQESPHKRRKKQDCASPQSSNICGQPLSVPSASVGHQLPQHAGGGVTPSSLLSSTPAKPSNQVSGQKRQATTATPNNKSSKSAKKSKKTKKIVCTCRTPFDDTKFYVGCDLCANWFHGDCVGISEALSRTMTEYICDECANAKLNKELYCLCKKPYDEALFYICCDRCNDWYHGRCVGIMQAEAEDIDEYACPKCDPHNVWNKCCQKKLTNKDYTELKKVTRMLIGHKNAWPFLEVVDPSEVPDYYKVVSAPMDLKTVERKVDNHDYTQLLSFIGDVMLIFDNCRLYNTPTSSFITCASTLESFFYTKVKQLKQKISGPH